MYSLLSLILVLKSPPSLVKGRENSSSHQQHHHAAVDAFVGVLHQRNTWIVIPLGNKRNKAALKSYIKFDCLVGEEHHKGEDSVLVGDNTAGKKTGAGFTQGQVSRLKTISYYSFPTRSKNSF